MILSGSPTLIAPSSMGYFTLARPSSVRTKIREALAFGISTTIKKSNGYFLDVGEVHVNAPANDNGRNKFPSVDIIWGRERYTNNVRGGNSLGGYNKVAMVILDWHLHEKKCAYTPEEIVSLREQAVADTEKYFGTWYGIPDDAGVHTAFNCIVTNNTPWGIEATEPKGGVTIELEVYYRIELTNPTQTF